MIQENANTEARAAFVGICRSWVGTPYVFRQAVKGVAADCASWLVESMAEAGIATREEMCEGLNIRHSDWWLHCSDDVYRRRLLRNCRFLLQTTCRRSTVVPPGCILLQHAANSKIGNHSGTVTEWPRLIHCGREGVAEVDATSNPMWLARQVEIFDPFPAAVSQ